MAQPSLLSRPLLPRPLFLPSLLFLACYLATLVSVLASGTETPCGMEESVRAREAVHAALAPFGGLHGVRPAGGWPPQCVLALHRGTYARQLAAVSARSASGGQRAVCALCGKAFRTMHHANRHVGLRHADAVAPRASGQEVLCLAQHCDVLLCPPLLEERSARRVWSEQPCSEADMAVRAARCRAAIGACYAQAASPEELQTAAAVAARLCGRLSCAYVARIGEAAAPAEALQVARRLAAFVLALASAALYGAVLLEQLDGNGSQKAQRYPTVGTAAAARQGPGMAGDYTDTLLRLVNPAKEALREIFKGGAHRD